MQTQDEPYFQHYHLTNNSRYDESNKSNKMEARQGIGALLKNEGQDNDHDYCTRINMGLLKANPELVHLFETMERLMKLIKNGTPVNILLTRVPLIQVDRAPHNRLLLKLQCLGIDG